MKKVLDQNLDSASCFRQGIMPAFALLIFSFCGLALEVSLIRLYSVIYLQGYVYLLISLSVAGLGFGAVWVYYANEKILHMFFRSLSFFPMLLFVSILGVNYLSVHFLFSLIPTILLFACIGASTTLLFQKTSLPVPLLYFADLCGAAMGAICSFYLLNAFGTVRLILLLLVFMALSSLLVVQLFYNSGKHWTVVCMFALVASGALFFLDLSHAVSPRHNRLKDMSTVLADKNNNPRIVATRWTSFGRSDLVETDNPLYKTLYIDGAAGTKMLLLKNGDIDPALERALKYEYIGGIPLLPIPEKQRENAAVIGSGGGIDVVTLLAADYKNITAVEINPDFIEIVRKYSAYNGNIYNNHPNVEVVNQEGRTYIRSANRQFDLIHMSLPIIKSARNIGSYALTENHLFTYEAFNEYLAALHPEGYLIVVAHYIGEAYRLVANAVKAFEQNNIPAQIAMRHIVLIGRDSAPALIIRKNAFTEADAEIYYGMIRTLGQVGSSNFIPYVDQHMIEHRDRETGQVKLKPMINELLYSLSRGEIDLEAFVDLQPENVTWISDDSPFFYQMKKILPKEILIVFCASIILLILLTIFFRKSPAAKIGGANTYFIYFGIIGCAFMMVEIAVIQKFVLLLGHETVVLAYLLSLILVSTGLGSYVSGTMKISDSRLKGCLLLAIAFSGVFFPLSGQALSAFTTQSIGIKLFYASILIFPLFFMIGFPFPTLLSRIKQQHSGIQLFPWVIGVNSIATMVGGCLAVCIAMLWGYSYVLIAGTLLYGAMIVFLSLFKYRLQQKAGCRFDLVRSEYMTG